MQDIELLESLIREIDLDSSNMENEIKKIVDINDLSKVAQKRVLAALSVNVPGGPAFEQAVRIGAAYYEAFMLGYRYRAETAI